MDFLKSLEAIKSSRDFRKSAFLTLPAQYWVASETIKSEAAFISSGFEPKQ